MGDSKNAVARKLVVLSGKAKGTTFVLTQPEIKAGREADNGICLKGKRVSRHHAVLLRTNGEYTLRDLSPRIGTLLNGRARKEAALKLGDRIRIGDIEMRYEAAIESPAASAPTVPAVGELAALRLELAAAKKEAHEVRALAERTAAEFVCARVEAETSAKEYQQRIAELTQENERRTDEVNLTNETLESLRAQAQEQPVLLERINTLSQENAALAEQNATLQSTISQLEDSVRRPERLENELTNTQTALQQMSEELAETRKPTKLDAIAEELSRMLQTPAGRAGELEQFQAALAEIRGEWERIADLRTQVDQLTLENSSLQIAAAKAQEDAARAKRCLSDQTNKEFEQLRRAFTAKQDDKPDKSKFWPFKAASRTS